MARKTHLTNASMRVTFEDTQTVFFDENAIEFDDPDHSIQEERFILLGLSQSLKILVVCHCYRSDESKIRLFQQERQPKRSKAFILGGYDEKRI